MVGNKFKVRIICAASLIGCTPSFCWQSSSNVLKEIFKNGYAHKVLDKLNIARRCCEPQNKLLLNTFKLATSKNVVENVIPGIRDASDSLEEMKYVHNNKGSRQAQDAQRKSRELFASSLPRFAKVITGLYALNTNDGPLLLLCGIGPVLKVLAISTCYGPGKSIGGPELYAGVENFVKNSKTKLSDKIKRAKNSLLKKTKEEKKEKE